MLLSTGVVIENNEFPKAIQNIKISTKNLQKNSIMYECLLQVYEAVAAT